MKQRRVQLRSERFLGELTPHDLLHLDEGFALARFVVAEDSPALGRKLVGLRLKDHVVQNLAIERGGVFQPIRRGGDRIQAGDHLVVFGRATATEHLFDPDEASALEVVDAEESMAEAESGSGR